MVNRYFIQQYLMQDYAHGGIGLVDAEKVLSEKGYQPILLPHQENFSFTAKIARIMYLAKTVLKIKRNAVVVFLYPGYARIVQLLINLLLVLRKDVRLICFLTDIDGIKDGDENKLKKETAFFRRLKYFIVHNENMKQWLIDNAGQVYTSQIDFFDFLARPSMSTRLISGDIVFAGNLEKSPFLEDLHKVNIDQPSLHFNVYGPNYSPAMLDQPCITWHGIEQAHELPDKLKGSFGLLWDGTSIHGADGSIGKYMQYISHHKLSLYILGGLPVIVPRATAGEALVKKYQIGFAVTDLFEIEKAIESLSEEEYQQMRKNMQPLAEKISAGGCLGQAMDKLMADIVKG